MVYSDDRCLMKGDDAMDIQMNDAILEEETKTEIPAPIAALENATVRFNDVCEKGNMLNAVYSALNID